jgi:pectin methylesterase-like acyl-CoA thioesterase
MAYASWVLLAMTASAATIKVAKIGGDFATVQAAIDSAPESGASISIAPGEYREVLKITKNGIQLRGTGDDPSKVVIVFDKSNGTAGGTTVSSTADIQGDNFYAENLTFQNDYNRTHPQGLPGNQAVAVKVTSDRAVFRRVRFLANQDTLYPASKRNPASRQYFVDCYIEGNVDFIFGDAKAVFENCEIRSNRAGYVTAQSKMTADQDSGYVFHHCRLTAEPGVTGVWLGRPWRPYSKVVYIETEIGAHIEPAGWREWAPGQTKSLETSYYAEFGSTGPGANPKARDPHSHQLTAEEAAQYETRRYLAGSDGWDPTKVK